MAVDTSVALPLLLDHHPAHGQVTRWWSGRPLVLAGHALVETYSVLTRMPRDVRLSATDAAALLLARLPERPGLSVEAARRVPDTCAAAGINGGAVYDAMVALAAVEHDLELATRDARALSTYAAVGARVLLVR